MGCMFSSNTITLFINNVDNYYSYSQCNILLKFYKNQELVLEQTVNHSVLDMIDVHKDCTKIEVYNNTNLIQINQGPFTHRQYIKINKVKKKFNIERNIDEKL